MNKTRTQEFRIAMGRGPTRHDLTPVDCDKSSEPLHSQCGWCEDCHRPRFDCYCQMDSATPLTVPPPES